MAHSAHKNSEEYVEHFDAPDVLEHKLDLLAEWVRQSEHFIAFTGAGISTAAGIPDFRSGMNTVLETGPGAWTIRAEQEKNKNVQVQARKVTSSLSAIPTPTHMALVELQNRGILKYLISQNTDGLHRRSGILPENLSELHGNSNRESCKRCGAEYIRDFRVRNAKKVHDHITGRLCMKPGCQGPLEDTIINFGESLPEDALNKGYAHSYKADICLAMGSSLRVTPAAELPELVATRGKKLVVVNLQGTPLDDVAELRINAKCDDVMRGLMQRLELPIPEFRLRRRAQVSANIKQDKLNINLDSVDVDGTPMSLFTEVTLSAVGLGAKATRSKEEPHNFKITLAKLANVDELELKFNVAFQGHYREPDLDLLAKLPLAHMRQHPQVGYRARYLLEYNPFTGHWAPPQPIRDQQGDEKADDPNLESLVAELARMGFDSQQARQTLISVDLNVDRAVAMLVNNILD